VISNDARIRVQVDGITANELYIRDLRTALIWVLVGGETGEEEKDTERRETET
jgi:hypothetical protein